MKKIFIWGAGAIGKRILTHLDEDWEVIFVDSKKASISSCYCGKEVISIDRYLKEYSSEPILVAHLQEEESVELLKQNHISNYFIHCDLPGEFKEPYTRNYLKEYVIHYLQNRTDYILYGLDLYSIIIDSWIYKQFGIHPYILLQEDISSEFVEIILQKYEGLNLISNIQQTEGKREICICLDSFSKLMEVQPFCNFELSDLFDCSDKIAQYHNPEIKKFHGLFQGKRCFIIATGPSLKIEDLNVLKEKGELCISMNSIFHAFEQTDWRPDYYVAADCREINADKDLIDRWLVKGKFISDTSKEFWEAPHEENVYRYHQHYAYYFQKLPKFSEDFSSKSYAGCTVTYTCLQLAAYMGFKEIYLLGVDFSYGGQKKNMVYTHFHKEENLEATGYVNQVALAYESARQYADSHGIKIYNATRGGKLEIFERVDFDSLF